MSGRTAPMSQSNIQFLYLSSGGRSSRLSSWQQIHLSDIRVFESHRQ